MKTFYKRWTEGGFLYVDRISEEKEWPTIVDVVLRRNLSHSHDIGGTVVPRPVAVTPRLLLSGSDRERVDPVTPRQLGDCVI